MSHSIQYSKDIVLKNFGTNKNTKIKFSQARFSEEIECAYISGVMQACEYFLNTNTNDKYSDVDELVGDIQVYMLKEFEYMRTKHIKVGRLHELTISKLMECAEKKDYSEIII